MNGIIHWYGSQSPLVRHLMEILILTACIPHPLTESQDISVCPWKAMHFWGCVLTLKRKSAILVSMINKIALWLIRLHYYEIWLCSCKQPVLSEIKHNPPAFKITGTLQYSFCKRIQLEDLKISITTNVILEYRIFQFTYDKYVYKSQVAYIGFIWDVYINESTPARSSYFVTTAGPRWQISPSKLGTVIMRQGLGWLKKVLTQYILLAVSAHGVFAKSPPSPAALLLLLSPVDLLAALAEVGHLYFPTAPAVARSSKAFLTT